MMNSSSYPAMRDNSFFLPGYQVTVGKSLDLEL